MAPPPAAVALLAVEDREHGPAHAREGEGRRRHLAPTGERRCHSTLPLTATVCHSVGICMLILRWLLSRSVKMTVPPTAGATRKDEKATRYFGFTPRSRSSPEKIGRMASDMAFGTTT